MLNPRQVQTLNKYIPRQIQTLDQYKPQTVQILDRYIHQTDTNSRQVQSQTGTNPTHYKSQSGCFCTGFFGLGFLLSRVYVNRASIQYINGLEYRLVSLYISVLLQHIDRFILKCLFLSPFSLSSSLYSFFISEYLALFAAT